MIVAEAPPESPDNARAEEHSSSPPPDRTSSGKSRSNRLRDVCLATLTFLAVTQALYAATAIMLPVVASIVAALACRPIVRWMATFRIPAVFGAAIVLTLLVSVTTFLVTQLIAPTTQWAERAPIKFHLLRLQRKLEPVHEPLTDLSAASEEFSRMASATSAESSDAVQQVVVKPPALINEVLSSTTQFAAGAFLFLVLTYFFLAIPN